MILDKIKIKEAIKELEHSQRSDTKAYVTPVVSALN